MRMNIMAAYVQGFVVSEGTLVHLRDQGIQAFVKLEGTAIPCS